VTKVVIAGQGDLKDSLQVAGASLKQTDWHHAGKSPGSIKVKDEVLL
jgi:hypothetical protein